MRPVRPGEEPVDAAESFARKVLYVAACSTAV